MIQTIVWITTTQPSFDPSPPLFGSRLVLWKPRY